MAIDRQKQQRRDHNFDLTDNGHLNTILRIHRHRKTQTHASRNTLPRQHHGAKNHLYHEAHGKTDRDLAQGHQNTGR